MTTEIQTFQSGSRSRPKISAARPAKDLSTFDVVLGGTETAKNSSMPPKSVTMSSKAESSDFDGIVIDITPSNQMRASEEVEIEKQNEKEESDVDRSGRSAFMMILDAINPLQHIPIISHIYRAITGDEINTASRVSGGFLYGGPIGAVAGLAAGVFEYFFGDPVGDAIAEVGTQIASSFSSDEEMNRPSDEDHPDHRGETSSSLRA